MGKGFWTPMKFARAWGEGSRGWGIWAMGGMAVWGEDDEISLEMEGTGDHEGRPYRCWLG